MGQIETSFPLCVETRLPRPAAGRRYHALRLVEGATDLSSASSLKRYRSMTREFSETPNAESNGTDQHYLILVIEDVRMIHQVIERTLRDLDAEFTHAQDGLTGLAEIERALPDLIILDLALPILDGWEVLKRLQVDPRTAQVPVLIITAHGQSGLEDELKAHGANAFLDKPFQPKRLRAAVLELLGLQ